MWVRKTVSTEPSSVGTEFALYGFTPEAAHCSASPSRFLICQPHGTATVHPALPLVARYERHVHTPADQAAQALGGGCTEMSWPGRVMVSVRSGARCNVQPPSCTR